MKRSSIVPSRVEPELVSRRAIRRAAHYAVCILAVSAVCYLTALLYQVGGKP